MKKEVFLITAILLAGISLLFLNPPEIVYEDVQVTAPPKPDSVPDKAFWVGGVDGGAFIIVSNPNGKNDTFSVQVYNDQNGELEYSGALQYTGDNELASPLNNPTLYQGWDGDSLHLAKGGSLKVPKQEN